MNDLGQLERLIADVAAQAAGPSSPVDVAAITHAATSHASKRRLHTVFSATRFVVAGAIVALFGGFALAVVLTQPEERLPAVGATASAEPSRPTEPAVDVRELAWRPLDLDETIFGPGARLMDIAASDSMLVIGGSVDGSAAVWTSSDGLDWERVPHDREVFVGPGDQLITAIVPWRDGFVAAGEVDTRRWRDRVAAVWISDDGTHWARVPHDEDVFGRPGRQVMFDIAATDERLVIAGDVQGATGDSAAFWVSDDGLAWTRQTSDVGLAAVEGTPDGFVGVGGGVWRSSDGLRWERTTDPDDLGPPAWLSVSGITQMPGGFVAVGSSIDDRPAVWTSTDGETWAPASIGSWSPDRGYWRLMDVVAADSGLAAVAGPGYDGISAILTSLDGTTWVHGNAPERVADAALQRIAAFGSHFVAIGGLEPTGTSGMPVVWTTIEPSAEPAGAERDSTSASAG